MELHSYLLFIGASIALCAVPGPDMILLLSRTIAQGRRAGLVTAVGINVGSYLHLLAAIAGLSAIIATSAYAFMVVKFAGAAYLIYLGLSALRARTDPLDIGAAAQADVSPRACFWQGFWSDVLNPKVAIFYLAFLPQFLDPHSSVLGQLVLLGVTANVVGILCSVFIVCGASLLTARLRQDPRVSALLGKALGAVFVALGIRLAGEKAL
jgi:threonine/homoserine/homoserine lactone efflux protein